MKLLTLEGTIIVSSAQVKTFEQHHIGAAARVDVMPSSGRTSVARTNDVLIGPALLEAGRLLADSAAELESSVTRSAADVN